MNITDFRHLPFDHIPDAVIDAFVRDKAFRLDLDLSYDWKVRQALLETLRDEHAEAHKEWLLEAVNPGQVVIDALAAADVVDGEWSADAPGRIEAALREAGWKLTPL